MSIQSAYELQRAMVARRLGQGDRVAGYKVGCVSAAIQAQLGIDRPVFGHVFDSGIRSSGAALRLDEFDGLAIEGEFAVRIRREIPDETWLQTHPDQAISSAFAVIELHHYGLPGTPQSAQQFIANNAIHAGVVMPDSEPAMSDLSALLDASIQVRKNGVLLGTASGRVLPDGPYGSLLQLVRHLAEFGEVLRGGQIVLTGSPLPLYRVAAGDRIEVSCGLSPAVLAVVQEG